MQIKRRIDTEEQAAFMDYIEAKRAADQAVSRLSDAEAKLLNIMQNKKQKTVGFHWDGVKHTATYTQRTTNQINENGLRKALTAKVYDKFTVKKLDRKALENAMTDGEIDPVIVAKFVEQVPGKTYLTYRTKDDNDEG